MSNGYTKAPEMVATYIGNDQTITMPAHENMTATLDLEKAMALFVENAETEVLIGMRNDWFFTAIPIESVRDIETLPLMSSSWDFPVISIDGIKQECYILVDKKIRNYCYQDGYNRGVSHATFWTGDLVETVEELLYDDIITMRDEINEIIARYQPKRSKLRARDFQTAIGKKYHELLQAKMDAS